MSECTQTGELTWILYLYCSTLIGSGRRHHRDVHFGNISCQSWKYRPKNSNRKSIPPHNQHSFVMMIYLFEDDNMRILQWGNSLDTESVWKHEKQQNPLNATWLDWTGVSWNRRNSIGQPGYHCHLIFILSPAVLGLYHWRCHRHQLSFQGGGQHVVSTTLTIDK